MNRLVLYAGQGEAVLLGHVTRIEKRRDSMILHLAGANALGVQSVIPVRFPAAYVRNMKVREGSRILVAVDNHFALDVLRDGGTMKNPPVLNGKRFVYSGYLEAQYGEGNRYVQGFVFGAVSGVAVINNAIRLRIRCFRKYVCVLFRLEDAVGKDASKMEALKSLDGCSCVFQVGRSWEYDRMKFYSGYRVDVLNGPGAVSAE